MAATRRKDAARPKVKKNRSSGLTTRQKGRMSSETFAFPAKRKEPLNDARHVRNAVARFDQVEGVTDKERDAAWRRIRAAARKFGVQISARGWRQLMKGGKRAFAVTSGLGMAPAHRRFLSEM
jgi:hypothetical protein